MMRRWKAWIAGALALAGLAAIPSEGQARTMPVPDLLPVHNTATPVGSTGVSTTPTCQYGYYGRGYGRPFYGYRRHYGYRRFGYRRPFYGYRRHYGYRRPYGFRHRFYRPIGFYGRPYGYHHYGYRPYGYRHYGW